MSLSRRDHQAIWGPDGEVTKLRRQRDELLAALEAAVAEEIGWARAASAVIAKAKEAKNA